MAELKITAANFNDEVLHADTPVLHEIAEENAGALKVGKVNVDEQMELAMRFQVSSIPMLVVFKDGQPVAKTVGYRSKEELNELLRRRGICPACCTRRRWPE